MEPEDARRDAGRQISNKTSGQIQRPWRELCYASGMLLLILLLIALLLVFPAIAVSKLFFIVVAVLLVAVLLSYAGRPRGL